MKFQKLSIKDFLDNQVREFSISVIKERAIPSVIDGMKPSQRKVVYTANKTAKSFIKTIALVGKVLSEGGYQKGDGALGGVITGITQDFAGANNIPWLEGSGEFGSRKLPKGAAAERYTKVKIHQNFSKYFQDQELHEYDLDEGEQFEPRYFLPAIPTLLLNPASGIAVGFACKFLPYNEKDIIKNIQLLLDGKEMKPMLPYFKGFNGKIHYIQDKEEKRLVMDGIITKTSSTEFTVSEVPVGISREQYIEHLEKMIEKGLIQDYKEQKGLGFHFSILLKTEQAKTFKGYDENKLLKAFKLRENLNENLNAISENNTLIQFNSVLEIIQYFFDFRMNVLTKRKAIRSEKLNDQIELLIAKLKFVNAVVQKKFDITKLKNKNDLETRIKNAGFCYPESLVSIPIYNLTVEYIEKLKNDLKELSEQLRYYTEISEKDLYLTDLKNM